MSLPFSKGKIKVFISSVSLDKEVKLRQSRVVQCLEARGIEHTVADTAEGSRNKRELRMLMMGNPKPPPQIFNGNDLCGDYQAFALAVEDEVLEKFLLFDKPKPKTEEKENNSEKAQAVDTKEKCVKNEETKTEENISKNMLEKQNDSEKLENKTVETKKTQISEFENNSMVKDGKTEHTEKDKSKSKTNIKIEKNEFVKNKQSENDKKDRNENCTNNDISKLDLNLLSSKEKTLDSKKKIDKVVKDEISTSEESSEDSNSSKESSLLNDLKTSKSKNSTKSPIPPLPPPPLPPPQPHTSKNVPSDQAHIHTPIPFNANDLLKGKTKLKANRTTNSPTKPSRSALPIGVLDAASKGVLKVSASDLLKGRIALKGKYDKSVPKTAKLVTKKELSGNKNSIGNIGDHKIDTIETSKNKINDKEKDKKEKVENKNEANDITGKRMKRRNFLEKDPVPLLFLKNSLKSVRR